MTDTKRIKRKITRIPKGYWLIRSGVENEEIKLKEEKYMVKYTPYGINEGRRKEYKHEQYRKLQTIIDNELEYIIKSDLNGRVGK